MVTTLTFCCDNSDLTRPILTGEVEIDGVDLTSRVEYPPRRHRKFAREQAYDISELCLATYLSSRNNPGAYPFTAIPVFPSRKFRHSFFYKRSDSDIEDPGDLAGKHVGVQSWQTAANVWMRGISEEHYGLDLTDVTWYRRREDDIPINIPSEFDVREVPGQQDGDAVSDPKDMRELFFNGELDAVMDPSSSLLRAVLQSDDVELMFENPIAEEKRYYAETNIHPPMHIIAIRDEVIAQNPWVAEAVYSAFQEARDIAIEKNRRPSYNMLQTWSHIHLAEQESILGERAWEYGLTEKTRTELSTFIRYARSQGIIQDPVSPKELFVESILS